MVFIRTDRLFLRPCWPEDRHEMLRLVNSGSPAQPSPLSAEDAQRFVERPVDNLLPHFFITLPNTHGGEMIGGIGLGRDGGEIGLGYWIAQTHRSHGYAVEAIGALLTIARTLGHTRIIAGSPAPSRVLERAGFIPTGELHSITAQPSGAGKQPQTYVFELSRSPEMTIHSGPVIPAGGALEY